MIQRLQGYDVPSSHEIFSQGTISPVSQQIGLTLLIMKVFPSRKKAKSQRLRGLDGNYKPPAPTYGYTPGGDYYPNELAGLLMSGDPAWCDKVGSIMVARQDGEPLLQEQLGFLWGFLAEVFFGGDKSGPVSQQERAEMLTRDFVQMYYEEKAKDEEWLTGIPSPFELGANKQADVNVKEVTADEDVDMDRGSGY